MTTNCEFESALRHTLRHLYSPSVLEQSPLIGLFGLGNAPAPAAALRRLIVGTIRSLQPDDDVPDYSPMWSTYEILLHRYVHQCGQLEIAQQLGLSTRHLRRKESEAIAALARHLGAQIPQRMDENEATEEGAASPATQPPESGDLSWLQSGAAHHAVDLAQVLASTLQLARPLAAERRVQVSVAPLDDLPPVAIHPVGLRQILLSLLGIGIHHAAGGVVEIDTRAEGAAVVVTIRAGSGQPAEGPEDVNCRSLAMAERLAEACGTKLDVQSAKGSYVATVAVPALGRVPVLVLDDNRNTLELLARYAMGTRYQVHGVQSLDEALAWASRTTPHAIMVDIMMPDLDGWEALGRLRHHPLTQGVPIIVCTILPEETLALSLGASAFLAKPLSRSEFLDALDRVCPAERVPR